VGARERRAVDREGAPIRGCARIRRRRSLSRRRESREGKRRAAERVAVFVVDSRSTIDTGARRCEFLASPRAYDACSTCASVSPALSSVEAYDARSAGKRASNASPVDRSREPVFANFLERRRRQFSRSPANVSFILSSDRPTPSTACARGPSPR
jgi:hypothetical protein